MPQAVSHPRAVSPAAAPLPDAGPPLASSRSVPVAKLRQPRFDAAFVHPSAGLLLLPGACLQVPAARLAAAGAAAAAGTSHGPGLAPPAAPAPAAPSRMQRLTRLIARWQDRRQAPRMRSADSLSEILRSGIIDANTTVILDLDQTLIRPQGRRYPYDRSAWPAHTEPVESTTAKVVSALQHSGLPVFGLTARGAGYRSNVPQVTHRQLAHIGVDLRLASPVPEGAHPMLPFPALTSRGVTYCGHNSKGEVFEQIAHMVPMRRAVLIDDGLHNFASMFAAASAHGIDLTCVYYRHGLDDQQRADDSWDWFWTKYLP